MKTIYYAVAIAAMTLTGISARASSPVTEITVNVTEGWEKDADGAWAGKDMVWYKLDEKGNLWWSKDGKKWEMSKDGIWQDKDGKWLKTGDNKLWWTADGKEWSEVPEWKWQGSDGVWYKFDAKWMLWYFKK